MMLKHKWVTASIIALLLNSLGSPLNMATAAPQNPDPSFAIGLSTINMADFDSGSVTALLNIEDTHFLQLFLAMPRTSALNLGEMLLYKGTVLRSENAGVHVGGGAGMANVNHSAGSIFSLNLILLGGFHFSVPGLPRIQAHLDGGFNFYVLNTTPASQKQLSFAPLSSSLGLSIVYYL
jgi:hypothetical protein